MHDSTESQIIFDVLSLVGISWNLVEHRHPPVIPDPGGSTPLCGRLRHTGLQRHSPKIAHVARTSDDFVDRRWLMCTTGNAWNLLDIDRPHRACPLCPFPSFWNSMRCSWRSSSSMYVGKAVPCKCMLRFTLEKINQTPPIMVAELLRYPEPAGAVLDVHVLRFVFPYVTISSSASLCLDLPLIAHCVHHV